jgi:Domain of unknown function (DU1801)
LADFVEGFLSNFPDEIQAICRSLRETAKHEMKGSREFLFYDTIAYSLSSSLLDRICYVKPLRNRVTLGFLFGKDLDDPAHLLGGTGKEARHIEVRTLEETKNPALRDLLKSAWKSGARSLTKMTQIVKLQKAQKRKSKGPRHTGRSRMRKPSIDQTGN